MLVQIGEKEQGCSMILGVKNNIQKQINLLFKKLNMKRKNLIARKKAKKNNYYLKILKF